MISYTQSWFPLSQGPVLPLASHNLFMCCVISFYGTYCLDFTDFIVGLGFTQYWIRFPDCSSSFSGKLWLVSVLPCFLDSSYISLFFFILLFQFPFFPLPNMDNPCLFVFLPVAQYHTIHTVHLHTFSVFFCTKNAFVLQSNFFWLRVSNIVIHLNVNKQKKKSKLNVKIQKRVNT